MQHQITFPADEPFGVLIVTSGEASPPGFRAFVEEFSASPSYRPGMNLLVDHTHLDANSLADGDIRGISDLTIEFDAQIGPGHCALVVPTPHKFRLASIWQEQIENHVLMQTGLFYTRDFAVNWLRNQRPSTPSEPA